MTDRELTTLLRDHVQRREPPFAMTSRAAIAAGRRSLVRRRLRRGATGVLVAAAAVAAVPLLPWDAGTGGDDRTRVDPLTAEALADYDAAAMPALVEQRAEQVLARSVDDLGPATFSAGDGQGNDLPPRLYDKASSMEVSYGGESGHRLRVTLMHARSEAEGDARESCANDVQDGYAFSCTVTTSADGDPVVTRVSAMRKLSGFRDGSWGAVTREELRTGVPGEGSPSQEPIDPDEVYFERSVESVHSKTFLTVAQEIVRAPDLTTATRLFEVPVADLTEIVTDPVLVIPEPPLDDGGCPWTLPGSNVTCGVSPE